MAGGSREPAPIPTAPETQPADPPRPRGSSSRDPLSANSQQALSHASAASYLIGLAQRLTGRASPPRGSENDGQAVTTPEQTLRGDRTRQRCDRDRRCLPADLLRDLPNLVPQALHA